MTAVIAARAAEISTLLEAASREDVYKACVAFSETAEASALVREGLTPSVELYVRLRTAAFSHWLRNAELFVRHSCHMRLAGLRPAGMQLAWCLIGWATPTKMYFL